MSSGTAQNINNSFFEGSYKDVWRKLIPQGLTEAEADFIEATCGLKTGHRVLDIMCGYGRHALELGKRGMEVTAIDNLEDYIQEINEKAANQSIHVKGVQADVVAVELNGTYDAIICMGNSFSFFNSADALQILQNLSAHIKQGGKLIINSWMIGEIAIRHFKEKDWYYVGTYKCLIDNKYLLHPSRIESEQHIIHQNGEIEVTEGVDYIFTIAELEALLKEASFTLKQVYSTPRKKPFLLGDSRAYIVAERD